MTIAQGLKEKNRIAGRIADLEKRIKAANSWSNNRPPVDDSVELFIKLTEEKAQLVRIKHRLAVANAGIAEALADLGETKGLIKFLELLPTGMGGYPVQVYDANTRQMVDTAHTTEYAINTKRVNELLETYRNRVDELQDSIDAYNAITKLS
jgi:hypothetical protein